MADELLTWDEDGLREWDARRPEGPVLMHSLRGFIDAGHAGEMLTRHVLAESEPVRLATFDVDALLDYRSRRPEMTFNINEWVSYDEPRLQVDLVTDARGTPFALLHGSEPDIQWERYIRAVRGVVERLGARLTLGAHGIPMAAPHTRPLAATVHGTRPDLLPTAPSFFGTVTVPASASNLLEYRFGQWDMDAVNIVIHVPHYLAQSQYPQAAVRAMESVEQVAGLRLSPEALDEAVERAAAEIERQAEESPEVQALVAALEEQYDDFVETRSGFLPLDGALPTAEELGAEFEQFLAERGGDGPANP